MDKQVTLECLQCGTEFIGPEPQFCCSGHECGCMGMPIDLIVCSDGCYDDFMNGVPRPAEYQAKRDLQFKEAEEQAELDGNKLPF